MTETSVVQQATALEHKFKTWLIRSTRMKFNIGIKEIVFTRYPILILILFHGSSNYYGRSACESSHHIRFHITEDITFRYVVSMSPLMVGS